MSARLTISLDEDFAEDLKRIAKAKGEPVSRVVASALKEWLVDRERRHWGEEVLKLAEQGGWVEEGALEELERMRDEDENRWP